MKTLQLETINNTKKSRHALAAANIRKELKHTFPGIKFSVTSESYSGGSSIDVSWVDGVPSQYVDSIVDKYQQGSFDGYTDMYNNDKDFDESHGSVKYTFSRREYSDASYREALANTPLYDGEEAELYINDDGTANGINTNDNSYQQRFYAYLTKRDFTMTLEEFAQFEKEKEIQEEKEYQERKAHREKEIKSANEERKAYLKKINTIEKVKSIPVKIGEFISLKFANLNKNNTLGEYKEEVKKGDYRAGSCKVEKVAMLSNKAFDTFSLNLMSASSFLGEGGTQCDDPRLKDLDKDFWQFTDEEKRIYQSTCYNLVTAIIAPDRKTFFVDAQGYKYARYVAIS